MKLSEAINLFQYYIKIETKPGTVQFYQYYLKKLNKYLGNELDWIILSSKHQILFYDENQSVKPSDIDKNNLEFTSLEKNKATLQQKKIMQD